MSKRIAWLLVELQRELVSGLAQTPKWYENIPPEGVRCRVTDHKALTWRDKGAVIKKCHPSGDWFDDDAGETWRYATPISELEGEGSE